MRFYIDITDSSGNKLGPGPITSASEWQSTKRLDRIGEFSFTMPAADSMAAYVASRRYATCYAILATGPAEVGSGIIDRLEYKPDTNGNVSLVVSGPDLLKELSWRSVGLSTLSSGVGGDLPDTHSDAVVQLSLLSPGGWTFWVDPSPPNNDIFYSFRGETLFAALAKVAELSRSHFRLTAARTLTFSSTWTDSGLRAIEAPTVTGIDDPNICYIDDLTAALDSTDLVTRIYAYGQEIPDLPYTEYISSFHVTKSLTGYTKALQSGIGYYIERTASVAAYGRLEEWISYNEIKAPANTGSFVTTAANQMFDLAVGELERRGQPVSFYSLRLAHSPAIIQPMTKVSCIFRRDIDGRNIISVDQDMYVMGATTRIDASGLRTTDLEVATYDRWQPSNIEPLRKLMQDNLRLHL